MGYDRKGRGCVLLLSLSRPILSLSLCVLSCIHTCVMSAILPLSSSAYSSSGNMNQDVIYVSASYVSIQTMAIPIADMAQTNN